MEPIALIVGAALGSAGIGGALAGLVQFSRASRTTRLIEQMNKSLEGETSGGAGAKTLALAMDGERLKLASISVISAPQTFVPLFAMFVVTLLAGIVIFTNGLLPWSQDRDGDGSYGEVDYRYTWMIILGSIGYVVLLAFYLDMIIQRSRARFMRAASEPGADVVALIQRRGRTEAQQPQSHR